MRARLLITVLRAINTCSGEVPISRSETVKPLTARRRLFIESASLAAASSTALRRRSQSSASGIVSFNARVARGLVRNARVNGD